MNKLSTCRSLGEIRRLSLIIFSTAVFCSSCSKNNPDDNVNPPTPIDTTHIIEAGKSSVLKNGVPWNVVLSAYYYSKDKNRFSLTTGIVVQNGLDNQFWIDDINAKEGLQMLERENIWNLSNGIPSATYAIVLDGDQYLNGYSVDTTICNQYIEILHYDSLTQMVEGKFQTVLEGPNNWPSLPDTIKMTEGKFYLKIKG